MKPRAAGVLAVICALLLAVLGGFLIARPPWSILGAIVLVGASILLSVGAVWLLRRSWSDPWPPYVTPTLEKRLRRFRILLILNSVLLVAVVTLTVYVVVSHDWGRLLFSALLFIVVLSNLSMNQRTLRYLRVVQSDQSSSEHHA
ncbi:hypothetical protein [Leifsonia sp. SIMBA_070]|uniref:hypothetical protein n=1 Tax=Leifsonia sp. SIMBA_070 TaxID=3085810 RepID=UPI00397DF33B